MRAAFPWLLVCVVVASLGLTTERQLKRPAPGLSDRLAARAGDLIYLGASLPTDERGRVVQGDIAVQATRVLTNISTVLEAAGSGLGRVISTTVTLRNPADLPVFDRIYGTHFNETPPARTTVFGDLVIPGALVQIQVTAAPNSAERRAILPSGWARPAAPYSYAIQSGDTLFTAGLVSRSGTDGSTVDGDVRTQVRTAMDNAGQILAAAGMTLDDTVSARVVLRDIADFPTMNEIYRAYWERDRPARATVVAALPEPFNVEITLVAIKGRSPREVVIPMRADGSPQPRSPNLSPGIRVGNRLFITGYTGSPDTNKGDVKGQTLRALETAGRILKTAGFQYSDVVFSEVWLTNVAHFDGMEEGYRSIFPRDLPVRSTVGIAGLAPATSDPKLYDPRNALVEIALTAVKRIE